MEKSVSVLWCQFTAYFSQLKRGRNERVNEIKAGWEKEKLHAEQGHLSSMRRPSRSLNGLATHPYQHESEREREKVR